MAHHFRTRMYYKYIPQIREGNREIRASYRLDLETPVQDFDRLYPKFSRTPARSRWESIDATTMPETGQHGSDCSLRSMHVGHVGGWDGSVSLPAAPGLWGGSDLHHGSHETCSLLACAGWSHAYMDPYSHLYPHSLILHTSPVFCLLWLPLAACGLHLLLATPTNWVCSSTGHWSLQRWRSGWGELCRHHLCLSTSVCTLPQRPWQAGP